MPDTEISPRLDAHFAHPPPIRPGLLPHGSGHPAPVRQYDAERMTAHPIHATQVQTFTAQDLEHLQSAARLNPSDQKLHLTLAKKLVEAASILTSGEGRADIKTKRKTRENYIFDAHKIIKRLTNSSHPYPDAMFYLASCYGEGQLGLQVDHERAFNLYQSAAKLNHGPSAYRTAVCGELGAGVRKDPQRAMTWYKKAAALGETPAMFKLGMILWKGLLGQPRNLRDGLIWLKRAADQADENNQHALHELGLLYESDGNEIIIPDIHYARELFLRAAELGYSASQFRMGYAYEYGTMGCPIDPRKSIAWYSKASMKGIFFALITPCSHTDASIIHLGDHEAQLALSGWYLTGSDGIIQQSDTEAYLWARKASERGLAKAEYALGYYTEVGIGVSPNLDEAKRWYYKAASQQHPKAQLRLHELKKGGIIVQRSRERLSRSNVKGKEDDGDCIIM
ncbi:HCP-like protein [Wilcoxina mikolae CBS 423.85]|nr:HCP-like protein [Wilcoxina mikolae CBS 423.85]